MSESRDDDLEPLAWLGEVQRQPRTNGQVRGNRRQGKTTTERGYGHDYQKARKKLLKDSPQCYWCGAPATTADHEPPIHVVGYPHLNLVPACEPCNLGRRSGPPDLERRRREWIGRQSRDW